MSTIDLIAGTAPEPFSTSKTSNWVARVGGLPTLFQHVAHDLMEKGKKLTESAAIRETIGIVHNWAHGHDGKGNRVSPAVVAEAVKAIAEWDSKRARAHAMATSLREHAAVELAFSNRRPSRTALLVQAARYAVFGESIHLAAPSASEMRSLVKQGKALPAPGQARPGRFQIRNADDLAKAIRAVGRAGGAHDSVRRFVIKRARELGLSDRIPDNWKADGSLA